VVSVRARALLARAKRIDADIRRVSCLPSDVVPPTDQPVLPHSLFRNTRGYIERIVHQINSTYSTTCYDACAVMVRRLVEVLIIEAFEHHGLQDRIKDSRGEYKMLGDLVPAAQAEQWSLGRRTKTALDTLKTIGDQSAHSRRYNAKREYIDAIVVDLRTAAEELLYLSGLRK
jgi:hypothetical protein